MHTDDLKESWSKEEIEEIKKTRNELKEKMDKYFEEYNELLDAETENKVDPKEARAICKEFKNDPLFTPLFWKHGERGKAFVVKQNALDAEIRKLQPTWVKLGLGTLLIDSLENWKEDDGTEEDSEDRFKGMDLNAMIRDSLPPLSAHTPTFSPLHLWRKTQV